MCDNVVDGEYAVRLDLSFRIMAFFYLVNTLFNQTIKHCYDAYLETEGSRLSVLWVAKTIPISIR